MSSYRGSVVLMVVVLLLGACSTMTTTGKTVVNVSGNWAILPLQNYSSTPRAEASLSTIVETRLRSRGVLRLTSLAGKPSLNVVSLLDQVGEAHDARNEARAQGIRYAVSGTVHEWHYKTGSDREPAVGISLKIVDLQSDQVVWQGSAARSGWGYSNTSSVADRLVRDLLKNVRFDG